MPFLKPLKKSVTKLRIEACNRNGLRHAIYTSVPSSRRRYVGEWRDDKMDGKGSQFDVRSGLLYEGDWSNGTKYGYGELYRILPDKSRVRMYSGNWINNKREGFGRLWWNNGGYYEGNFRGNERHGFGRMWSSDETFYQGTWKNDVHHGEGMLILANGNRFEGHFSGGKKEGRGIFYHINTGQLQDGCWLADTCMVSTIEDIDWRQSAPLPTSYPIPKNELTHLRAIFQTRMKEVSLLCDPESLSFSANYEDYANENINCR